MSLTSDIQDFQEKFFPELKPTEKFRQQQSVVTMRLNFMLEELEETAKALGYVLLPEYAPDKSNQVKYRFNQVSKTIDRAEVLDGLVDLLYVLIGTVYQFGLDKVFPIAWKRVHNANMQKARCETPGKRGTTFDVRKPKGWKAADLSDLVK